ncbi:hypothetical protein JMJ35_001085 [Cladonia borealis]|uniref:BTB domain-containing protein n=1 Tax=Cladonia borealis TaxID=184061 RepID=A0AA39R7T3_9LECA|nr:hypothetical protein JMJ35_001085 [Cladonia borealis]
MSSPVRKSALSKIQDEQDDALTVNLVDDGDLRIHVTRKKHLRTSDLPIVTQQTFLVSSAVMRIASPVWRIMFDPQGHFMESQRSLTHGDVDFPEDDPDALLCILRIAHLQFRKIPETLDYAKLLNLAIICDKYDTVALVRPWVAKWEEQTKALAWNTGCEGYLFIAWTFGDSPTYEKLAKPLVYDSTSDKAGRLLNCSGNLIGDNFPPAAFDTILTARRTTIAALFDACYKLVDSYLSDQLVCQHVEHWGSYHLVPECVRKECDTLVFGSLVKGMKGLGIWPTILTSGDYHGSISELMKGLRSLPCFMLAAKNQSSRAHTCCSFMPRLDLEIKRIEESIMPSGVDDSHREHMRQQAQK